ncbi:MAG TPA: dihydroorotase [Betaproteobacteria bacterium]|nr:dihydroorotase [Betaproteobacteria bacterium]
MIQQLTLTRPDDWHLHVRDGDAMRAVVGDTARCFGRAVIMPNLKPPVVNTVMAMDYRARIIAALPPDSQFSPLMTLYLTDSTTPAEIARAKASGGVLGVKLYPAGATTNSAAGVTEISRCFPALEAMEKQELPLLVHGEATDPAVDVFDREKVFIDRVLALLIHHFPGLRLVLEHVTTRDGVDFVQAAPPHVAATITAHHLLMNRNAMFQGGIRPHHYCLPVLKRESHRQALVAAAIGGSPKFFLGTDSAPHGRRAKESSCGCAGVYTAHAAIELYAEAFEAAAALERLEAFASFHGADFYGLPRNADSIRLCKESQRVPDTLSFGDDTLVPLRAGGEVGWRLIAPSSLS